MKNLFLCIHIVVLTCFYFIIDIMSKLFSFTVDAILLHAGYDAINLTGLGYHEVNSISFGLFVLYGYNYINDLSDEICKSFVKIIA